MSTLWTYCEVAPKPLLPNVPTNLCVPYWRTGWSDSRGQPRPWTGAWKWSSTLWRWPCERES